MAEKATVRETNVVYRRDGVPRYPLTPHPGGTGDLDEVLIHTDVWTDVMLADAGIPVRDVPIVAVGGGIGSFVFCDYLRIGGVPSNAVRVLGNGATPWENYEYLTRVSQIPRHEVLRSDSLSCPD